MKNNLHYAKYAFWALPFLGLGPLELQAAYPSAEGYSLLKADFETAEKKSEAAFLPIGLVNNESSFTSIHKEQGVEITVKGKVVDENGVGLPGVAIKVKDSTLGTITDMDGNYSLSLPDGNATLVFSFIGYNAQSIALNGRTTLNVALAPDVETLSEVVVVGYGVEKKKDVTGAVASVSSKDFNPGIAVAPEQLVQGKVAGVNIVQDSGQPGAASTVRIRGANSISAGNDPLYVVDGVPMQFGNANLFVGSNVGGSSPFSSQPSNPLNTLNPADIESIDILKDASATAIYGSRGANGVIVITTKSKKVGEAITYDTYASVSSVRETLPFLSADEYRDYARSNNLAFPDEGANTNWQEEIFRNALSHNHNIAFGGGSVETNFRASLGYTSQEGVILSSGLEKYTGRLNANHKALDGKLRIGLNMTYGMIFEDNTPISSNINNEGGNILKDALRWAPSLPVRNPDGSFYQIGELRINPVSWVEVDDERNTNLFLGSGNVAFDITEALTFQVNAGYTDEGVQRFTNVPGTHPAGETEGGRASINKLNNHSTLLETTLNYNKSISSNSNLTVLGGYSFQRFVNEFTFTSANKFVSSAVGWNLIQSGNILSNTSFKTANRLSSYFGRVNYKLMDRYLFTFTLRNDGSSRFGENNRWGLFPSGAVAWRISEENFFTPEAISNFKIRAGYGITGNQEIPNDLYRQQLSIAGSAVYVLGGQAIPSVLPSNFANPDLQWEQTSQLNVGVDFGIFDERFTGSLDFYRKHTTDLLLQFSTAAPSVVESQWANVGEVENKGIELALNANIIRKDKLQWDASVNFTKNKNTVLSLSNEQFSRDEILMAPLSGVVAEGSSTQIVRPGLPLGTFYGRKFLGYDENGMETYLDEDGKPGADLVVIGNALPEFLYGITNNLRWGRFDASATFRGVMGNDVFNNTAAEFSYANSAPGLNVLRSAIDDTQMSRAQPATFSSRWIEDGSYLRLDNLSLGYSFNTNNVSFLHRARLYVTAQNLFVITDYTGFDPEVRTNTNQGGTAPIGIDYLSYPRPRIFQLGGSFSF